MHTQTGASGHRENDRGAEKRKTYQARDSLIRIGFRDPTRAGVFARVFGPIEFAGALADGPAEILPTKFISQVLRPSECDARFRMETNPDGMPLVESVLEAKSSPSREAPAQLIGYVVCALLECVLGIRAHAAICGILLYTGDRPWKFPLSLDWWLPGIARLGKRVLNIHIHIVDFSRLRPEHLYCGNSEVTAILLALYYSCVSRRKDLNIMHLMVTILRMVGKDSDVLQPLAAFFESEYDEVTRRMVERALRQAYPKDGGRIMANMVEKIWDEGRTEGRAEVLSNVLRRRFGPLPEQYSERIAEAGPQEIEDWFMQVCDGSSLDQVFNGHGKG